jgi:LPS export ABC transporter protein LptC
MNTLSAKWKYLTLMILSSLILFCCEPEQKKQVVIYDGPLEEMENVDMLYSEKDQVKVKMIAKKIFKLQNGDEEFPEGLYLEFYDEFGKISSTLQANHAYFFKGENKWRGRGNVIVKNIDKAQQLNTEELFWRRDTKKIFTEKFVTIRDAADVIYGTGLDADQDLSNYVITKPEGEFDVKEN